MRINSSDLTSISREKSLRCDCVYHVLVKERRDLVQDFYPFSELFDLVEEKIECTDIQGSFMYCQIGDVEKDGTVSPVTLNFDERSLLDENYYRKIEKGDVMRVDQGDILMSFLLPQDENILGKFTRIGKKEKEILFSTAFIRLQAKKHPQILYYSLQSLFYRDLIYTARIRKGYTGYATLSKEDLKEIRFQRELVDLLFAQHEILEKSIADLENQIHILNKKLLSEQSIIDAVFEREFHFDYGKFEEMKAHKVYALPHARFSDNPDLRFGAKYHRPAGSFVMEQLKGISDKKIKHFLSEPIALGASISPGDFDESGEAYYVSMATIKTFEVVLDDTQLVSSAYFHAKKSKTLLKGDILMARSGVAIGKTAIVRENFQGIFADFTMRIRFDPAKCSPLFAYYYLRSKYFQYLIEIFKKGLQNQNIFPIVMQELPIPDVSLKKQLQIVKKIQTKIQKQNYLKDQIGSLRSQIYNLIKSTVESPLSDQSLPDRTTQEES